MIDGLAEEARVRRMARRDSADLPLWSRRRERLANATSAFVVLAFAILASAFMPARPCEGIFTSGGISASVAYRDASQVIACV